MATDKLKISVTTDTVKADLAVCISVLKVLQGVIPQNIDQDLIDGLAAIQGNPMLLNLIVNILSKV